MALALDAHQSTEPFTVDDLFTIYGRAGREPNVSLRRCVGQDHEEGPFRVAGALSGVGKPLFCEFLAFIAVVDKIEGECRAPPSHLLDLVDEMPGQED